LIYRIVHGLSALDFSAFYVQLQYSWASDEVNETV